MQPKTLARAGFALLLGMASPLANAGAESQRSVAFPDAEVRFEQNATDKDVEVVFDCGGAAEGLSKLLVRSPDGRIVVDFSAPDASTLGIRSFRFESPEPRDVAGLKAAYPEGVYTFTGTTVSGVQLHGESELNHALPPTVTFEQPAAEAEDVSTEDLEIVWSAVAGVNAYVVEIEDEEHGTNITARLSGTVTRFHMPDGFLRAGTEYTLAIATESDEGNLSFVETSFVTAGGEDDEDEGED